MFVPQLTTTRSPMLSSHIDTGLRRIRNPQQPPIRNSSSPQLRPQDPSSPPISPSPSRSSSFHHASPGPATPGLQLGEDLTRFPSESLHSFSFAHQGSDSLRNRQNVLKRSIDFMRERLSWASSTPRIATAQAKLAGDEELLSMMELLQKANMMDPDGLVASAAGLGISGPGPLTGPAYSANDNVFEQSFQDRTPNPHTTFSNSLPVVQEQEGEKGVSETTVSPTTYDRPGDSAQVDGVSDPYCLSQVTTAEDTEVLTPGPEAGTPTQTQRPQRAALKRTYTDVAGYSLEHRLTEALAQPYHTTNHSTTSFRPPPPARSGSSITDRAPHGHRNNQAQAIFTTDAESPWTITAANDLACLVFGVTRAEVRKLGIMEVIDESRRKWLAERLRAPDPSTTTKLQLSKSSPNGTSPPPPSSNLAGALGNGITAKLLSKPPSRYSMASRRSKSVGGGPPAKPAPPPPVNPYHANHRSRGVLLCGDVVPIRKRDGSTGSASLWVKEKSGGLIWVLEEIAEDVAYLTIDEIGSVLRGTGDVHAIWGIERVRNGSDVKRLIPAFPKLQGTNTGAVDYEAIAQLRGFTARTSNSISIPITVEQTATENLLRITSLPNIAGIIVLKSSTMRITSSNSVFTSALFGYSNLDDMSVDDLIPGFSNVLHVMTEEDKTELQDGIVIPEHSFRRARALLALREGKQDAAQIFLRPSGLPARHRDGAEIMVDVQMRVVLNARELEGGVIVEEDESGQHVPTSELVYALWITYSRQLHAVHHGVGPVAPMMSRPGTPPQQPPPGSVGRVRGDSEMPSPLPAGLPIKDDGNVPSSPLLDQQLHREASTSDEEPFEHPSTNMIAAGVKRIKKKLIEDFNILEELGQGAYGQVKLARYKKAAAKKMVIKYVTKRRILVDTWHRDRRLGTVPLEIHVLDYLRNGLQHPNIVEMMDWFENEEHYHIEMEPHGAVPMDLFDYIEMRSGMDEVECRKIFVQVAEAIAHLHVRAKVVHRDIKDENIVLDGDGMVKLVDFGSAAYIKSGPFDVFVGTIDYAAPEVLRGLPYRGKEQDIWALGVTLYTLVFRENPFYNIDEIMDHSLRIPYVMSEDCIDLIRRMLDRDVERRIGIQAVLEHPWCTTVDDEEEEKATGEK
ncbi:hypothetical protein BDY17DRAFT_245448 [Neohortaea acidophila]|uniref:non-specific serine/threonine protein kinase n=1 Tax=Neohortaea acidophila TaxID=245834 RepID=A0A6A6Q340_9PEZI|nr:uncharacterized protein BDY17DRAFT_245448 [Neohortaea acidophila]KAF2486414.1 hypothetical protein BDY17DRAFT_245448 [Neohortaea acidophila]